MIAEQVLRKLTIFSYEVKRGKSHGDHSSDGKQDTCHWKYSATKSCMALRCPYHPEI